MSDKILRATAADGAIRIFVADTKDLVNEAFRHHNTYPVVTAALGRLLTAGAIMGVMQKSDNDKLTIKIDGDGPIGSLTVTADSKGRVKGYARNPKVDIALKPNGKLDVSGAIGIGVLTIIKDLGLKEPYVGSSELISGEIAEDITYYFSTSEQIPSSVGLGVLVDTDYTVRHAGGFIIQLMPFAEDEIIDKLEENLKSIKSVTAMYEDGMTPENILNVLAKDMNPVITDEIEPEFYCNCSKERVKSVLSSLNRKEIDSMLIDGKPIEVHCDFCNSYYTFSIDEIKEL